MYHLVQLLGLHKTTKSFNTKKLVTLLAIWLTRRDKAPNCLIRVVNQSTLTQTVINSFGSCLETSFNGEKNYLQVAVKQKYLKRLK